MRRIAYALLLNFVFLFGADAADAPQRASTALPAIAVQAEGLLLSSTGADASFKAGAGVDTFCLYGGPGSLDGKFQDQYGVIPDPQGWTHRDVTDQSPRWQLSTFNSPTGTQAYWAGQSAAQQPGWAAAPGYGNQWNELLQYTRTVSDPSVGQTVGLTFSFNHDSEPFYDYFIVEYDSASTSLQLLVLDGSNKDSSGIFSPLSYPADVSPTRTILYAGNDYAGPTNDEIVIRLRVISDGAWSDEDGLFPSAGAAQVDDITVTSSEGVDLDDFNAGAIHWTPQEAPFAGDFSKAFARSTDLDPCRENTTPLIGFIDDGTPASNPGGVLPNGDPIPSIGTTSINWNYGIPGGWVVNYNGGVSFGSISLDNEWWSPEIDWDLPGTADDGIDVAGAFIRFSVYRHLPLVMGIFYQWSVRGRDTNTGLWSPWDDRSFVYYGSTDWLNSQNQVSDLLPVERDKVQLLLAVRDLATVFAFPGNDATPSPLFDNVSFQKYKVGGPSLATRSIDLFGDSFAQSGLADPGTQATRDLLDCRIDMARSVSSGVINRPGDSMIVDVESVIPGVAISDPTNQIRLHYSLDMNPTFESAIRGNAPVSSAGTGRFYWDQSQGTVAARQSTTDSGVPLANRWFFDLPDVDFMYPGDVLEYYIEAVDDDGRTSTLPADLSGFADGTGSYSRVWTTRALPTYFDPADIVSQPQILWWNDFGHRGGEAEVLQAFAQQGRREGYHFDTYTTKGPTSLVDNGLGSAGAHGATAAQLAGYNCIVYESGDLVTGLISDGSDDFGSDKSDDVGLLMAWFNQPEKRQIIHFGDNLYSYLAMGSAAQSAYLSTVTGVNVNDADVRDEIGNQSAPHVISTGFIAGLTQDFIAFGGCLSVNRFDSILPRAGAVSAYGFEILGSPGSSYGGNSAAVVYDRIDGGQQKLTVNFPYGFLYVHDSPKVGPSARAILLEQALDLAGYHYPPPDRIPDTPAAAGFELHRSYPNPFNPSAIVSFTLAREGSGSVRVYNLRGELVRNLSVGKFVEGLNELEWNGRDDGGATVASGVYVVKFDVDGFRAQQKVVMVK